jgi:hypothetical protein
MPVIFAPLPDGPAARKKAWHAEANELRENIDLWARVAQKTSEGSAGAMANAIQRGTLSAFRPAGSFEAVTRGKDVWARYVGALSVRDAQAQLDALTSE